jgi:aspartate aminotransferase-like enzyme
MSSDQKLIMLPGPTNVSERVMQAMLQPVINHRGDTFRALYKGIQDKSRRLFQTEQDVIVFSSSGTGGVEAAVWNVVRPGDAVLVPVFGEFSKRVAETVELAGGKAVEIRSEFGSAPSLESVRAAMDSNPGFKSIFIVHNETSTGVAIPYVKEACLEAKQKGAFVVIDAISSLGGYALPMDEWGMDVLVTGSQKCIAAPPGLALVGVSKRVAEFVKKSPPKTRYFDMSRYLEYGAKAETPFTPALPIFYALDEALKELLEEGLAKRVERHDRMSAEIYNGVEKMGLKPVAAKEVRSKTVIATYYPEGVEDAAFRKTMSQKHAIVLAGGFGPFAGKVFRIGCMGQINKGYVDRTMQAVEDVLKGLRTR